MQIQSFNAELALANLMFLRLFNNITIQRTNKDNNTKQIKVNCQLGQKSRIYKNWQNAEKRAMMKLPMIVVSRTGYTRNGDRLNNMHNEIKYEITSKCRKYDMLTPIPIDISYDVSIMSKYPSDIDQIASNFMVFFNPDVYVTCQHPKYEGIKLNNHVVMSDGVTEEHPDEIDGSTDDFITATFQFTFKTYLFGGNQQVKKNISKYILSTYVSADSEISSYVINPEYAEQVYDGFTPIIKTINVGFYATPRLCAFQEYMDFVDSKDLSDTYIYADKLIWKVDDESTHPFPYNVQPIRLN